MDQEKKSLHLATSLFVILLSLLIVVDFLMRIGVIRQQVTGIHPFDQVIISFILSTRPNFYMVRVGFVLGMIALSYFQGIQVNQNNLSQRLIYILLSLICATFFMVGYGKYVYYNVVVYPSTFLALYFLIPGGFRSILIAGDLRDTTLNKVSKKKDEYSFSYQTDKGLLHIHDIRTATFIEGSAKAGKTASIIIPTIIQAAKKCFAGLIYDYEGDLREEGGGVLTHVAFTAIKQFQTPVKFAVINFTDLSRTMRCNPLSPRYISSYNHAQEIATVIMYNINRIWSKQKDFWGENAIAAYAATIWFFRRNYPSLSTIPHTTEFLLNDFQKVLKVLNTDDDVAPYIRPILAALERDASGQIAGAEASTQFPLARMRSPEVYYVLNPETGNELDLDITNKDHPVLLCVCNSPELQNALAPSIGAVIQVCKSQMNKLGKHKSIFLFDEMPTVYIDKVDKIPAEARKKHVCTFFAVQTYDQLVRDYGIQNAKVIRTSCGNIFTGISGLESAEMISRMMGEYKRTDYSKTSSDSGRSLTQSLRNEKVLMASKIASQQTGHFSGRILGGKPPYFSAQFRYTDYPVEEIPHFNYPVELDDIHLQEKILDILVQENYQNVRKEVKDLIAKYEHLFES